MLEHVDELFGHERSARLAAEVEERAACDGEQQAEPAGDAGGPCDPSAQASGIEIVLPQPPERQRTHERYGPLHHDEGHRDRAELVVAGQQLEHQLGEPHEILAPRQQEHEARDAEEPPAVAAAHEETAQHGEEHRDGAQIGRAGRVGLVAPVGGQLLRDGALQSVFVQGGGHGTVGREARAGVAAHEVGDQQVETLGFAVAPCRGIVEGQSVGGAFAAGGQFRAAAYGLRGVLGRVPQWRKVRAYGQHSCAREQGRAPCEVAERASFRGCDEFGDPEGCHRQQEVIGDLRVVGADFERGEEGCQGRAGPHISPERHPCSAHHQRSVDRSPHLGDVSGADDEEEVGRKPVGERTRCGDPRTDAHDQQHDPHGRRGEEEEGGGGVEQADDRCGRLLDELGRIGHVDQVGRHAAEHVARPLGVFARRGAVVADVLGHSFVLHHVVLGQHLAAELRGEADDADEEEEQQSRCRGACLGESRFRKFHRFKA